MVKSKSVCSSVVRQCLMVDRGPSAKTLLACRPMGKSRSVCSHRNWSDQTMSYDSAWWSTLLACRPMEKSRSVCSHSNWSDLTLSYVGVWWYIGASSEHVASLHVAGARDVEFKDATFEEQEQVWLIFFPPNRESYQGDTQRIKWKSDIHCSSHVILYVGRKFGAKWSWMNRKGRYYKRRHSWQQAKQA